MKKVIFFLCVSVFVVLSHIPSGYVSAAEQISEDAQKAVVLHENEKINPPLVIALKTDAEEAAQSTPGAPALIGSIDNNSVASRAVEKNVGLFSKRIKERFSLYLSRSGQYLELMKSILRSMDVPEDIVFLSLIESGFNPNAYSIARAVGPWQFISATAKRYGLQINWWRDERRDPVKSTVAAASYLKDLYGMFGSWSLAMAAYNAGEGKILKAMKRSKSDDYWDLLHTRHIKNETKEYVPRFIAASMIASNPVEFGFEDIEYHEPMSYDEVALESPVDIAVAAEAAGTDVNTIKRLNPELRRWCTPPDVPGYILRIPKGSKEAFLERLVSVPSEERLTMDKYIVKKGDTLKKITKKTGIPQDIIFSLNPTENIMPLSDGNVLYLPPKGLYVADKDDKRVKKVAYKIKRGKAKTRKSSSKS